MLRTRRIVTAFSTFVRWLARSVPADGLWPAAQTRKVLERERARADRTGERLSLVAFAARGRAAERATAAWLVKILKARLRSTDEAGWLDDRQVCAVLPNTPPEGAWKVVEDVCRHFPAHVPPPLCTVYSYPSGPPRPEGDAPAGELAATANGAACPARRVTALDLLLVKPMPPWKRGLDVLGASAGLMLLSPLLAGVGLAVKLSSPGPVLFRQRRSGRGGRPFVMYKFRTMVCGAEARQAELRARNERDGPAFKLEHDPRVTRLGRLLRSTSLDELPQLWNVLRGDMSLVGPRPLPCEESAACAGWQRQRLDVTPGLTCTWQVWARGGVSFADWVRMDLRYIRSRSAWQDLKLLLLTVPAVVLRRGAH
jgi:lipopolysaccharide/colanic/teichoic acid biosynthesis glycosyltransferase